MPPAKTQRAAHSSPRRQTRGGSVYADRLKRLRRKIREAGCDALLVNNPSDIRYLSGFHGEDSWALIASRAAVVISDFRFREELERLPAPFRSRLRTSTIYEEIGREVAERNLGAVALQAEHVTLEARRRLAKAIGASRLKPRADLLAGLRAVKDESEIALIRKAVRLQEQALTETLERVDPGAREMDIAAELEHRMKRLGAEGVAFPTIVASGSVASRPHYRPGKRKVADGRALLIDWGARVDGYCGDMTRTFSFGRWSKRLREVYEVVREAQQAALETIRAGRRCREIDGAARDAIKQAGYGEAFGHGLGHGLGLDVHEDPRLSWRSDEVLRAGMVVTVEPGVYLPGVGGVRIEDDVVVTDRGCRNLSSLPKDLDWATR